MGQIHTLRFIGRNTRTIAEIHRDGRTDKEIRDESLDIIRSFCNERNFKIYYTRIWNADGRTIFDVGSHTEFFHLIPEVDVHEGDL